MARALRWTAAVLSAGAILVLLSIPSDLLWIPDVPSIDKLAHTVVFGALMVVWCAAARTQWPLARRWKLLLAVGVLVALFGVYGELHQKYLVKGRYFSYWDMAANALGALLGGAFWRWRERRGAG